MVIMSSEYEATNTETIGQMYRDFRASPIGFGLETAVYVTSFPYIISSMPRAWKEAGVVFSDRHGLPNSNDTAFLVGAIGAVVVHAISVPMYIKHPEFLAFPAATNITSLAYEIGSKAWKNARKRVEDRKRH